MGGFNPDIAGGFIIGAVCGFCLAYYLYVLSPGAQRFQETEEHHKRIRERIEQELFEQRKR